MNIHISLITAKANSTLSMLQRNIRLAPIKIKELAYKSLYSKTAIQICLNSLVTLAELSYNEFSVMLHVT